MPSLRELDALHGLDLDPTLTTTSRTQERYPLDHGLAPATNAGAATESFAEIRSQALQRLGGGCEPGCESERVSALLRGGVYHLTLRSYDVFTWSDTALTIATWLRELPEDAEVRLYAPNGGMADSSLLCEMLPFLTALREAPAGVTLVLDQLMAGALAFLPLVAPRVAVAETAHLVLVPPSNEQYGPAYAMMVPYLRGLYDAAVARGLLSEAERDTLAEGRVVTISGHELMGRAGAASDPRLIALQR